MTVTKSGGEYVLHAKSNGRVLGRSKTKAGIDHREKQIVFFKNLQHSKGGPGSLAAKVKNKNLIRTIT